jgi:hypothetical protein
LTIPILMVVEPILWTSLFAVLGRAWSPGLLWSGGIELTIGVTGALVVGLVGNQSSLKR